MQEVVNLSHPFLKNFPIEGIYNEDLKQEHQVFFISFHDHWLTEEEVQTLMVSYRDLSEGKGSLSIYNQFEAKLLSVFQNLYRQHDFYTFDDDGENFILKSFDSWDEVKSLIVSGLKEEKEINLVIPNLKVCFLSSYDLTWPVYCFSKNLKSLKDTFLSKGINVL